MSVTDPLQTMVNGIYPVSSFTLSGVNTIAAQEPYWWSSKPRYAAIAGQGSEAYLSIASGGAQTSEYLMLDFGNVREFNYLNFQIMAAPIDITICYDAVSDDDGSHAWIPVTPLPEQPFDSQIYYDAKVKSAFYNAEFYFTNAFFGVGVATRFLRIEFARRDEAWPTSGATPFPWPIIVRGLRPAHGVTIYEDTFGVAYDSGPGDDDPANRIVFPGITSTPEITPALLNAPFSAKSGTSFSQFATSPSRAVQIGEFLTLQIAWGGTQPLSSVLDSQGNTWTIAQQATNPGGESVALAYCLIAHALATSDTVTASWGASIFQVVTSLSSWGPYALTLDQTATATSTGVTSISSNPLSQPFELVLVTAGWGANSYPTTESMGVRGYTNSLANGQTGNGMYLGWAWQTTQSTGSITADVSWSDGNGHAGSGEIILTTFVLPSNAIYQGLLDPNFQVGTDYICQEFGLPVDWVRPFRWPSPSLDTDISPDMMGLAMGVYVESWQGTTFARPETEAKILWEVWELVNGIPQTKLANGTSTAIPNEGRAWVEIFFPIGSPIVTDEVNNRTTYQLRAKTFQVHDSQGQPVLQRFIQQPNILPGFWLPGTGGTFVTAGNGASAASGSNTVVFPEANVSPYLQPGDLIRRVDQLSGAVGIVQGVIYDGVDSTVTLTSAWQGPSGTGILTERVPGMRYGINGPLDYTHSLCLRIYADVGSSGQDVLGNTYRYGVRMSAASNVLSGVQNPNSTGEGWICAPQPSPNAVEALYFDVRWATTNSAVIDAIQINPSTPGVFMHVYYCADHSLGATPQNKNQWDMLFWRPVQATYTLNGRMTIDLPEPIRANFIKLEFSNLQPRNLRLNPTGAPQPTLMYYSTYPTWVVNQFESAQPPRTSSDWFLKSGQNGVTSTNYLKAIGSPVLEFQNTQRQDLVNLALTVNDTANPNTNIVNPSPPQAIDETTGSKIQVTTNQMYTAPLVMSVDQSSMLGQTVIAQQSPTVTTASAEGIYNQNQNNVNALVSTSSDTRMSDAFANLAKIPMWFNIPCRHIYRIAKAQINKKAYQVGIQSVQFLRKDYSQARDETLIYENLWDDQMLIENTWFQQNNSALAALIGSDHVDGLSSRTGAGLSPIFVSVDYQVDGQQYTGELHGFNFLEDVAILLNVGTTTATNIHVYLTDETGASRTTEFIMGQDYTTNSGDNGYGEQRTSISVLVAGDRLVASQTQAFADTGGVIGRGDISIVETYTA